VRKEVLFRIIYLRKVKIMPKLKTRKAVKKRVTITKTGKAKAKKSFSGHLMTSKNRKRKRNLKQKAVLTKTESAKLRKMIV